MDEWPIRTVMTVAATSGPSQGWYPDPNDPQSLRWWNGTGWTEFTAQLPSDSEPGDVPFVASTTQTFEPQPEAAVEADDDPTSGWSAFIAALDPTPEPPVVASIKESPSAIRIAALDALIADVASERTPAPEPEPAPAPAPAPFQLAVPTGPLLLLPGAAPAALLAAPVVAPSTDADAEVEVTEPEPEPVEPEPEPEPVAEAPTAAPRGFSFRARALTPSKAEYESPLATIASPLAAKPIASELDEMPVASEIVEPDPEPELTQEVDAVADADTAADAADASDVVAEPVKKQARTKVRRKASRRTVGTAAVVVAAAGAAGITNLIGGGSDDSTTATDRDATEPVPAAAAAAAAAPDLDTECLKLWNTTDSQSAAELRVTLGQFQGAFAQVSRVKPLPGTLMEANSCGLMVYDPGTDTSAVFVAGVKDQIGYLDVTAYPRAGQTYGVPRAKDQANVQVMADGTLRAL